jgi:ribonucleoside-diphosphate reductase alpha chain
VPPHDEDIGAGSAAATPVVEATITKLASRGYIRGRAMTVVNGGAARMLEEDRDDHPHFHSGDSDFGGGEAEMPPEMIDVSAIGASVQAELASGVSAQVAALETALGGGQGTRAQRAAEARMKGFEGDSCGSCGNFTLVRNGTCMKCNTCGSTTGCS